MPGLKPLSEIFPEDTVEEIYEEINNDYIDIKPIEDIVFGEFKEVNSRLINLFTSFFVIFSPWDTL